MSEFKRVTVVKKANVFFNGEVTSRTILFEDGKKTLGIMQPGEYEFNVGAAEIMEILAGEFDFQDEGEDIVGLLLLIRKIGIPAVPIMASTGI